LNWAAGRSVFSGYRVTESDFSKINAPASSLKFVNVRKEEIQGKALGFVEPIKICDMDKNPGVRFHPDKYYWLNQKSAVQHRYACKMDEPDEWEMARFRTFCRMHFRSFKKCRQMSFDEWLAGTNYSQSRKNQLVREKISSRTNFVSHRNKSFIKDEGYDEWKFPRAINSYEDSVKVLLGPYIKSIEKSVYQEKFFVKGLDNHERDARLKHNFGSLSVCYTDFSHFESHHHGEMNKMFLEFINFVAGDSLEFDLLTDLVLGENKSVFSHVTAIVSERLMSGAMWTSLQNSVVNLFIISYLKFRSDPDSFEFETQVTMIEGDDGITESFHWDNKVISRLGICLKIGYAPDFSLASFCGRVITLDSCLTEPCKALEKLMWFPNRYSNMNKPMLLSLLKCRAVSLAYNQVGCPILHRLALRIVHQTTNIDHRSAYKHFDQYTCVRTSVDQLTDVEPSVDSRVLFEQLYGISIASQIRTEQSIASWVIGGILELDFSWPQDWLFCFDSSLINVTCGVL
jgi:hypothetical protein